MGARFYDEAIAKRLNDCIKNPNAVVKVIKPNEVSRFIETQLDEGKDSLILPQFSLSRSGYKIMSKTKQPKSYDGVTIRVYDKNDELINKGNAMKLNAVPISLEYQLDIYTQNEDEADNYIRSFAFNIINHPQCIVDIPYNNADVHHKFNIFLDDTVVDNSDISERLFPTQFVRYTMTLLVDDAYLFDVPIKNNVEISSVVLDVKDSTTKNIVEETVIDV